MPDFMLLFEGSARAGALVAFVLLLAGWPWRQSHPVRVAAAGALALGGAVLLGAWMLQLSLHFPPSEPIDRLLFVLLPAVVGVEAVAAVLRLPWLGWLLRCMVAAAAAPILLHGAGYITELRGSHPPWSTTQSSLLLTTFAVCVGANWVQLDRLAQRGAGRSVVLSLAVVIAGSGITLMLSGYLSDPQLAFPVTGELAGAFAASLILARTPELLRGVIGVAVVVLFGFLLIGYFFSELALTNGILLFAAPLLAWLPEWLRTPQTASRKAGVARVTLAILPVALALTLAGLTKPTEKPRQERDSIPYSADDYKPSGNRPAATTKVPDPPDAGPSDVLPD